MPELFHTSCRQRAAWTPSQRAAFDVEDARAEALEREFGGWWMAPEVIEAPVVLRLVRGIEDLTARRFGQLTVTGSRVIVRGGYRRTEWLCRCDCGREVMATGYRLKTDRVSKCKPCAEARKFRDRELGYHGRILPRRQRAA
jgi:hypothetical protein